MLVIAEEHPPLTTAPPADFEAPPRELAPESFTVHDESTASWVARKINEARERAAHVKAWANAETEDARRDEKYFLDRFTPQLQAWAKQKLADAKKKSINLPGGTLSFRTSPVRLDITDEEVLQEWASTDAPDLITITLTADFSQVNQKERARMIGELGKLGAAPQVTRTVSKSGLNDWFKTHQGEVPPGCDVSGGEETFYVK